MKRTPRFYIAEDLTPGICALSEEVAHHAFTVLRLQEGQEVVIFNGDGNDYHARIATLTKRGKGSVEIYKTVANKSESNLQLHLAQAISRKETMNIALQKAVELGVTSITPLLTEHTDSKFDPDFLDKRAQQWQKVIIGACEQSLRSRIPVLNSAQAITDFAANIAKETANDAAGTITIYLDVTQGVSLRKLQEKKIHTVNIIVGPEGGLSAAETEMLQEHGFTAVHLGPRVLRFETAAICSLALAQNIWGDV